MNSPSLIFEFEQVYRRGMNANEDVVVLNLRIRQLGEAQLALLLILVNDIGFHLEISGLCCFLPG